MTSMARRLAALALLCATLATLAAAQPANKEANTAAAAAAEATTATPECKSGLWKTDPGPCGGNCFCLGSRWVCPESDCATDDANSLVYAERCVPHESFQDGCHFCICTTSGIRSHASCTFGSCPPAASPVSHTARPPRPATTPTPTPTPAPVAFTAAADDPDAPQALLAPVRVVVEADGDGETTTMPAALRPCSAAENEVGGAPDCVAVPLDGERCAPGVTYMDECNTCICSQDGIKAHASCTFKVCPK